MVREDEANSEGLAPSSAKVLLERPRNSRESAFRGMAAPKPKSGKALQIYLVDVEGGQATLFVTPEGNSLLMDTGWPSSDGRDADRILPRRNWPASISWISCFSPTTTWTMPAESRSLQPRFRFEP